MDSASIEDEVIAFVANFTGYPLEQITPQTTLFGDLRVDGDDGNEILATFMERFSVDMSACRPLHFGPECLAPWAPLVWLLLLWRALVEEDSTPESCARLVPIRIQDLIDSAKAGRWTISYAERGDTQSSNGSA
jgi:hypothetical protein